MNHQDMAYDEIHAFLQREYGDYEPRISSLEGGFDAMFKRMERRFDEFDKKLDTKADKADTDRIYDLLDRHMKRMDTEEAERAATNAQLGRHEGWHQQTAKHLGIKLD